ncbi:MAG: transglycosylase domain-containing protein [Bacilli bacterium]|nr:transglycosylase domain-containing protein [Bacilli bacterium]
MKKTIKSKTVSTVKKNTKKPSKLKAKINRKIKEKGIKSFIWSMIMCILITVASLCLAFALYIIISAPNFDKDLLYKKEATVIYDINGEELARIGQENRVLITYEDLPQVFVDALIATEDSRFFQHNGLDIARFAKATFHQLLGQNQGGASTLTMQLIKNTYTSSEASGIKGIIRKFTDIYMAVFKLENCYTKEEILEFYANSLWFGHDGNLNYTGIYGVEQASQHFFGKSVTELTLAEASLLVGMYQNPVLYNPYRNPEGCRNRQKIVLNLMVNHGYLTNEEKDAILDISIQSLLRDPDDATSAAENQAVIDYILDEVADETGLSPYNTPMQIYTTIDPEIQESLNAMERGEIFKWYNDYDQEGTVVTDVADGSIRALSGGRNYTARGLNRATVQRQPGSTAKPIFDYGPYLEYLNGSTGTYYYDEPYTYTNGTGIANADREHEGMITMRRSLVGSRNVPALQAFQEIAKKDINLIIDFVHSFGIDYGSTLYESASIGGFEGVSPVEMSAAYGVFARGGYYIEPYIFTKIIYEDGTSYEHKYTKEKIVSEETAYMITDMLIDAVEENWSGNNVSVKGTEIAGKTGTTSIDVSSIKQLGLSPDTIMDSWSVSYTSEYVIALWYGYDQLSKEYYMNTTTGWRARSYLMEGLAKRIYSTNKTFKKPSGVIEVEIEKFTNPLQLPSENTPEDMIITELFREGTEPTEVSTRYATLSSPTNGKYTTKGTEVTLTWTGINTPDAISTTYLQEYFNDHFGQFASKYYEERIIENEEQFGSLGYTIYKKDPLTGELTKLSWVSGNTFTQTVEPGTATTFVIKSSYSKFTANESKGLTITVAAIGNNTPGEPSDTEDTPVITPDEETGVVPDTGLN